jgi:MFS family permease
MTWFYLVFILAGIANIGFWTIGITLTLEFGTEAERPAYIGLANTLVAPSAILAPLVGGWLADSAGYPASAVSGLLTASILHVMVQDPRHVP